MIAQPRSIKRPSGLTAWRQALEYRITAAGTAALGNSHGENQMTPDEEAACVKKATDWWRKQAALLLAECHEEGLSPVLVIDGMLLAAVQLQADVRGLDGAGSYLQSVGAQLIGWAREAERAAVGAQALSPVSDARH